MKYQEIANLSGQDLVKKSKEIREDIFTSRMKNSLGQLPNPMTIRHARRNVARLLTAISVNRNESKNSPEAKSVVKTAASRAKSTAKGKKS